MTRPALQTLQADQRALLTGGEHIHGLRDGFPSRQAAIEWYQAALVRTFGYLSEDWSATDLVKDATLVESLLDRQGGREYRRRLEASIVLPACNQAYNELRNVAGEYVGESGLDLSKVDPDEQKHVAMRPGFQERDEQQRRALEQLWSPFDRRDDLLDWLHWLDEPSYGEIDPTFSQQMLTDESALAHMLGRSDPERAQRFRERMGATVLLPAFADGLQEMDSGELMIQTQTEMAVPQG
jgi:hypothetical protein